MKIAETHNSLGRVFQELHEWNRSKEHFLQALSYYIKSHGKYHGTVVTVVISLARLLHEMQDHESSIRLYCQGFVILKNLYGDCHPVLLAAMEEFAEVLTQVGLNERAGSIRSEVAVLEAKLEVAKAAAATSPNKTTSMSSVSTTISSSNVSATSSSRNNSGKSVEDTGSDNSDPKKKVKNRKSKKCTIM